MAKLGLLHRLMDKYRKKEAKVKRFEVSMGKIMAVERIIGEFFDKYPTRRLPNLWVDALARRYNMPRDEVLNASRRVRKRLGLKRGQHSLPEWIKNHLSP